MEGRSLNPATCSEYPCAVGVPPVQRPSFKHIRPPGLNNNRGSPIEIGWDNYGSAEKCKEEILIWERGGVIGKVEMSGTGIL